ncbi:vacuolar transporter chaperone 4 [Purpureocillium lavendulum]|uniref:Vacuolar transporter chaperone 4 n=1 Tax=Purpureocillium lavendulum TaxID=1247861 RepID=A0AB34G3N3_9HYPO|nr:vacuolar transporter chaperone 4 [Purpureocillium lavendulum]
MTRVEGAAEAEAVEDLVEAQAAEQAVDEAAEAEAAQELADEAEHAVEQQADGGEDLEERLREEAPERVELLLGVGHAVDLALGVVDGLGDGAVGEVVLLGARVLGGRLVLGLALDAAVGVHAADQAVGLGEDLAALLDEGLDLADELLLVELLLGRLLGLVDLVRDHAQDGADLLERLLDGAGELTGQLAVLFGLLALLLVLGRLLRDVLHERDVADGVALGVDHVAVVVNLLAGADADVAARELADDVVVLVEHVAVAVDAAAGEGVLLLLDLGLLPALGLAQDVAVLVDDVAVLVDGAAVERLAVALRQPPDDVARRRHDLAVLGDGAALQLGKGPVFGALALVLGHQLGLADLVARLAHDVPLLVAHAAHERRHVALDDAPVDGAVGVDHVARLVDALAGQQRAVHDLLGLGLGLVPGLGLADHVAPAVEDVAVLVHLATLEALGVALDDGAHLPALGRDAPVGLDHGVGEVLKRRKRLLGVLLLVVGDGLRLADDLARIVPDVAVLVGRLALQLLGLALGQPPDNVAVVVDEVAGLVDLAALEHGEVDGRLLGRLLGLFAGGLASGLGLVLGALGGLLALLGGVFGLLADALGGILDVFALRDVAGLVALRGISGVLAGILGLVGDVLAGLLGVVRGLLRVARGVVGSVLCLLSRVVDLVLGLLCRAVDLVLGLLCRVVDLVLCLLCRILGGVLCLLCLVVGGILCALGGVLDILGLVPCQLVGGGVVAEDGLLLLLGLFASRLGVSWGLLVLEVNGGRHLVVDGLGSGFGGLGGLVLSELVLGGLCGRVGVVTRLAANALAGELLLFRLMLATSLLRQRLVGWRGEFSYVTGNLGGALGLAEDVPVAARLLGVLGGLRGVLGVERGLAEDVPGLVDYIAGGGDGAADQALQILGVGYLADGLARLVDNLALLVNGAGGGGPGHVALGVGARGFDGG